MTLKNIANEDLTIAPKEPGTSGTITVTSAASTKVKALNKGVYSGGIGIQISGATFGTGAALCTQTVPVNTTIAATATKTKADGSLINREDDESPTLAIAGTFPDTSSCTITFTAQVTDAGQTKAKAQ